MVLEFWGGGGRIKKQRLHIRLESLRFSAWFKKAFTRQDVFLRAGKNGKNNIFQTVN